MVPTYPPTTEFWWEPKEPLQIAFWSMSAACLLLIVLVVICCILWRNAKRQSDRFYDDGVFVVDNPESERDVGIDNNVLQAQPLRTRDNIYEYRDSPTKYKHPPTDASSIRAPSSLAMTQTTAKSISGSQSSLRSAISMKESTNISPIPRSESNFDRNIKYAERGVDTEINKNGKYPRTDSRGTLSDTKSREFSASTPIEPAPRSQQPTSQPASRGASRAGYDRSNNASRTNLIEGIPQTEV